MFPILKWVAAPALGLAMTFAGEAPQAEADDSFRLQVGRLGIAVGGGHHGHHDSHYGHGYRSHYRGHYGGHYGGNYGRHYGHHRSYRGFHDTSHFDYHPPTVVPHRGHFDYVPGHYDFHRSGHYHH